VINFRNQVPSVYTSASRDFQYLGWLINIVLNAVKHNVDDMYDLPNTKADPRLTELLALTLGFKVKRNYNNEQLAALVSIIPSILKYKGTKKAIVMAAKALLRASGTLGDFDEDKHCKVLGGSLLEVTLPKDLIDVTLFTDLMPYILPAGMSCRVVRKTVLIDKYITEVEYNDELNAQWVTDLTWNTDTKCGSGLAELFDTSIHEPEFAGLIDDALNTGLLANTVIPVLYESEEGASSQAVINDEVVEGVENNL
jgi:hypothetical protein